MKVAIVVSTYPPYFGGMGNAAAEQARLLQKRGIDVEIFTPDYGGNLPAAGSISVHRLSSYIRYGNAAFLKGIKKRAAKADAMILHYPFFGGVEPFALGSRIKPKLVVYYHMDTIGMGWKKIFFSLHRELFLGRLVNRADLVLASSDDYARHSHLARYLDMLNNRFQALPFCVDTVRFKPDEKPKELLEKYNLKETAPVALFVGSLDAAHYFKGVLNLLKAWQGVTRDTSFAKLIIVGEGNRRAFYESEARRLGVDKVVIFTGRVADDKLSLYEQLADVFVLPSTDKSEAFGIALLEAMASGCPIIASNLPGVRTLVKDGETGTLVPPGDVRALSSALISKFKNIDETKEQGKRARKLARKYSPEIIGDRLVSLLMEII